MTSTELLFTMPAGRDTASVRITVAGASAELSYQFLPAPSIVALSPSKGRTSGGDVVTISGFALTNAEVTFDGVVVEIISPAEISLVVRTRSHPAGPVTVTISTDGGTTSKADAFTFLDPPTIGAFTPASGPVGSSLSISGQRFDPVASDDVVTVGGVSATVTTASDTLISVVVPEGATTGKIAVTTAGGSAQSATGFVVGPLYTALTVAPSSVQLAVGGSAAAVATATRYDGTSVNVTNDSAWVSANTDVATVNGGAIMAAGTGQTTIRATFSGLTATLSVSVATGAPLPPDPATVAPTLDTTVASDFVEANAFLYGGPSPVQTGTLPGAIIPDRLAVLRGRVIDRSGQPMSGVRVEVLHAPEVGFTYSRLDGRYDIAVNGGGTAILNFSKEDYLTAQRAAVVSWHQFATVRDVALIPLDANVAIITSNAGSIQTAQGSVSRDSAGERQATLLFSPGTAASLVLASGVIEPIASLHVRATEYTIGEFGPQAMPASLPPQSGYTYCVELSADEAIAAGATSVKFDRPVTIYVRNFLNFPVGGGVPVGYYDREKAQWIAEPNGRIIKIISIANGVAQIDMDGDAAPDSDASLNERGITLEERSRVATLFPAGTSVWRSQISHFTPVDHNWPIKEVVPASAKPPKNPKVKADVQPDKVCRLNGSIIECESQGLGESLGLGGTPFTINYLSTRLPGRIAARTAEVTLTGNTPPESMRAVELTITIAGQTFTKRYAPAANLKETYTWDGRDVYGRTLTGRQDAKVVVRYEYPTLYVEVPPDGVSFGTMGVGETIGAARLDGAYGFDEEQHASMLPWDARNVGLGGWTVSAHHVLDPSSGTVYFGDGTKRSDDGVAGTIKTVVGLNTVTQCYGYDGIGTSVCVDPYQLASAPDGNVYFATSSGVKKVDPQGIVHLVAGGGPYNQGASGDGGPAIGAGLNGTRGVALAADGTLYIAEYYGCRIRRVTKDGTISRVAGTGVCGQQGDGGPALQAQVRNPRDLAIAPDGTIWFIEIGGYLRQITPDGVLRTMARTSGAENGEDTPLPVAVFGNLNSVATAPDGSVYLATATGVKRLSPDGMVRMAARFNPDCAGSCGSQFVSWTVDHVEVTPRGEVYALAAYYGTTFGSNRIEVSPISRRCQYGRANPMRRLAAADQWSSVER